MMFYQKVYALICPIEMVPRYVGVTTGTIKNRLQQHCYSKQGTKEKVEWISGLKKIGLSPIGFELERVEVGNGIKDGIDVERIYIKKYRSTIYNSLNY